MRHHIYTIAILLLCALLGSCSIKTRIKRADKKYAIGEYYDAAELYRAVYPRVSAKKERKLKGELAYKQAECYRILNHKRAANAYKNAIRYGYNDSIIHLHYAQVLHYQGDYKNAVKYYETHLQTYPNDYVAQAGLYACNQIKDWKKEKSRYVVKLSKEFNSKQSSSFAPAFIGTDADAIMFTSNLQQTKSNKKLKRKNPVTGTQTFNLYTSRQNAKGEWEEISLPEGIYNSDSESGESENDSTSSGKSNSAEFGVCSFTADGKTMYFTYSRPVNGQDLGTKIYSSTRTGGEWGEPQEIILFMDSSISVGHPSINATGDTLYFASDAPGYGGKDIWMAENIDGTWINVQNLGPQINTTADEMYPCIREDGILYFASNGHPGYGGLDIFKASPTERDTIFIYRDSTESSPLPIWDLFNLGTPFNSNNDDFGITFVGATENGYFSSNRGQKKGYDQIYSFVLPEMVIMVEGTVYDHLGDPIVEGTLRLVGNDGTNQKVQIRRDGTYSLKLQKGAQYAMLAFARGYLNQKQQISTTDLKDSHTFKQDFTLSPISKPVTMDNIFYEFGKWDLTPASTTGLEALVKLLNDNPNITIELSAHTDMVGDSTSNKVLSEKRAQSVVNYLISAGIEQERLTPIGYGENKPVVADNILHKKYSFIPEEQILDEAFISTLPQEQQDICNQINRRTEFKVLRTTYKLY